VSKVQLHHADCLDFLPTLPSESVDLVFCDPPYNIGIFCKMPEAEYLAWCELWIAEASRVLAANGALWVIHKDPEVLVELSRMITNRGRKRINWITWDKWNGELAKLEAGEKTGPLYGAMWKQICKAQNRSFGQASEFLVYHADEGEWTAQCDRERGFIFEPLRAYLEGERDGAGVTSRQLDTYLGNYMSGHYFGRSQWALPTAENYAKMRECFHAMNNGGEYLRREYEDLRREYEDLRREYEDLRYTFNNPGKVSSVWQIPPAPSNGHPTPKPEALLERIIKATTNEGDTVLDFFVGSGTTGKEAVQLGRDFIGCDNDEKWVRFTEKRIAEYQMQPRLEGLEVTG